MMFILRKSTVKGSNVFQLMTGLTEKINVFDIIIRERSFQSLYIAQVCSYTNMGFVFEIIAPISQL